MPIGLWTAARGSSDNLVHVAGGHVKSRQEGVHDVCACGSSSNIKMYIEYAEVMLNSKEVLLRGQVTFITTCSR